jgi:hypothetical protein
VAQRELGGFFFFLLVVFSGALAFLFVFNVLI